MRTARLAVLAGLCLGLILLGGCGGGETQRNTFTVSGTVVTDGMPASSATVSLLKNGQPCGQSGNSAGGSFHFAHLPMGRYTLAVAAAVGDSAHVASFVGPFTLAANQQLTLTAPSLADLGNPAVAANTATLVVAANDTNNTQVPHFTVTVGALTATAMPNDVVCAPTATVTGIAGSSATVVITNTATHSTVTVDHVSMTPNTVEFFQAVVPGG